MIEKDLIYHSLLKVYSNQSGIDYLDKMIKDIDTYNVMAPVLKQTGKDCNIITTEDIKYFITNIDYIVDDSYFRKRTINDKKLLRRSDRIDNVLFDSKWIFITDNYYNKLLLETFFTDGLKVMKDNKKKVRNYKIDRL